MPLIQKLVPLGKSSRAIVIPAQWLKFYERDGKRIGYLLMEVNNQIVLRIPDESELGEEVTPEVE